MSRFDAGAPVPADRTRRNADASRPSDPVRGSPDADASSRRDLIVVNKKQTQRPIKPSRYADALFLAHVFASKFDAPQTREKRRAEPGDANASYRAGAKRPAKLGRVLSKKI
jgi:hypothetical protein